MKSADTLLLINRSSGSAGQIDAACVQDVLDRGQMKVVSRAADSFPELKEMAKEAMSPAIRHLVIAGGDGTVSGFLPLALESELTYGVIPCGTANDFATSLGFDTESIEDAAARLVSGTVGHIDVGRVNGVPFLNAVGIGLGSQITNELDDEEKQNLGVLAYGKKLWEAVNDRHDQLSLTLSCDGETHREKVLQITVTNGIRYGGGMMAPDGAALDDGRLHVVTIDPGRLLLLIGLLPRFLTGRLRGTSRVNVRQGKKIHIDVHKTIDVTADGEIVTDTPCELSVEPRALRVLLPADAAGG
ncbi:MAG: YegS/Rv2252/BmrU family lipid kinase [Woeseiaceae bacterium]